MTPDPFGYDEAIELIGASLHDLPDIVLVGGQAVNYWADRYRHVVPELESEWPFTSEDIDFFGKRDHVEVLARRLNGAPKVATIDDAGTPNAGTVTFPGPSGATYVIDILARVGGFDNYDQLRRGAVPARVKGVERSEFGMMHPVHCLESRVHNVIEIPASYDNPRGLKQARAAVLCAKEYIRELVEAGNSRAGRGFVERIFRFSLSPKARKLFATRAIDVFSAVVAHPEFGASFLQRRFPQMQWEVAKSRAATRLKRIRRARFLHRD